MRSSSDEEFRLYVLSFDSTFAALAAQKALADINPAVIPVPREISAGCGMALRFKAPRAEIARSLIEDALSVEDKRSSTLYEDGGSPNAFEGSRYRVIKED